MLKKIVIIFLTSIILSSCSSPPELAEPKGKKSPVNPPNFVVERDLYHAQK
ncbi:hypothetical protein J3T28_21580 [Salmonella enterica]|nr:hypothetical protein [Salmonella enterica]MBH0667746.1 hypothetical protein [Salmonella enterica]MCU7163087.1 hypothetical protein [Salmonella enterica]